MRTLLAILIALMLFAATPVAAGAWEDGLSAYDAVITERLFSFESRLLNGGRPPAGKSLFHFKRRPIRDN